MHVALTGTPGTGKTGIGEQLRNIGYFVLNLNNIADRQKFFIEYDTERDTHEVDIERLNIYLSSELVNLNKRMHPITDKAETIFIEGHLSHYIDLVGIVIVLRCHPDILRTRLESKSWPEEKIRENLEAEALDVITIESVEKFGYDKVFEVDTTNDTVGKSVENIIKILNGDVTTFRVGKIDWSEVILKWY